MHRARALLREAITLASSQTVASLVSVVMIAGLVSTVLLTAGRTVGAQEAVIASIDSAGTRSIIVNAESGAGLESTVLDRIGNIEGISWAAAFGSAQDATNALVPGGTKVGARPLWASALALADLTRARTGTSVAIASPEALRQLGMSDGFGAAQYDSGGGFDVAAMMGTPDFLKFLEPMLLIPTQSEDVGSVSVLVVISDRPEAVESLAATIRSVLAVDDPSKVTISTSADLTQLRSLIQQQLGASGRGLVLVIFATTALLVAVILCGLVMLRRKDFGRRRALGASQGLIFRLIVLQMAILSIVGAMTGSAVALLYLLLSGDPSPGIAFIAGLNVLAIFIGLIAAVVPAVVASRRDPLRELRVP